MIKLNLWAVVPTKEIAREAAKELDIRKAVEETFNMPMGKKEAVCGLVAASVVKTADEAVNAGYKSGKKMGWIGGLATATVIFGAIAAVKAVCNSFDKKPADKTEEK